MTNGNHSLLESEPLCVPHWEHRLSRGVLDHKHCQVMFSICPVSDDNTLQRFQATCKAHCHLLLSGCDRLLDNVIGCQDVAPRAVYLNHTSGAWQASFVNLLLGIAMVQNGFDEPAHARVSNFLGQHIVQNRMI